jgi:hypothetical protein
MTDHTTTLLFAAIRPCKSKINPRSKFPEYRDLAGMEIVDLNSVQAAVGRIFDRDKWSIIDRSGTLAHVQFVVGGTSDP